MTTTAATWTESQVEAAGAKLQLIRGGTGDPLLVLHDEMGYAGWLRAYEALAQRHTLFIPVLPGYGASERLDWIMTMRDMAGWALQALEDRGLGPVDVIGLSLGGWLAAEMATMCSHWLKKLVLVAPPGLRPPSGEIFDMFLETARPYIERGFLHPQQCDEYQELYGGDPTPEVRELREVAREESCRLAWRPYMRDPALPHLLRGVKAQTLIVWGREDAIVPSSTGAAYQQAIPNSRLVTLDGCGHHPEIERSPQFVRLVEEFLSER